MKGQKGAMKSQGESQRKTINQVGCHVDFELCTEVGAAQSGTDRCAFFVP